jgi:hypothetical protein
LPVPTSCHWSIEGGRGSVDEGDDDADDATDDNATAVDADGIAGARAVLARSPDPPPRGEARADTDRRAARACCIGRGIFEGGRESRTRERVGIGEEWRAEFFSKNLAAEKSLNSLFLPLSFRRPSERTQSTHSLPSLDEE